MDVTFLVGNGFDKAAGLNSGYRQFYEWYINQPSNSPSVKALKENIKKDIESGMENWADFESALGRYTKNFSVATLDVFLECYEDAVVKLQEYLGMQEQRFKLSVSEAEQEAFFNSVKNYWIDLSDAETEQIAFACPGKTKSDIKFNFITFNYTSTLEKYIGVSPVNVISTWKQDGITHTARIIPPVLHVHGKLNNNVLVGVDRKGQIENKELQENTDCPLFLVKPEASAELGETVQNRAKKVILDSGIICLWGVSIGTTDAQWWEQIMKWLDASSMHHIIIFWYTGGMISKRSHVSYIREQRKIQEKMLEYTDWTKDKFEDIRHRIHIVFDTETVLRVHLPKASDSHEQETPIDKNIANYDGDRVLENV